MADTMRGNFPDLICSDCGEKSCTFKHWGPLVPKGQIGSFCCFCWSERQDRASRGEDPLPFGVQPPGIPEEFANRALEVITKSKSVYYLYLTGEKDERVVSRDRGGLSFTRARVLCLEISKRIIFKPRDDKDPSGLWFSTPVESIKPYLNH